MMIDCLFQLCNCRIKSSIDNYAAIAGLHPKGMAWAKVFLLIELYLGGLPADDKRPSVAMSQPTKVVNARRVDVKAIAELAKERQLLASITRFL